MPDFELYKACQVSPWKHLADRRYRFAGCRRIAKAFTENMHRVHGLLMLPGHAFMSGQDWEFSVLAATRNMFGEELPSDEVFEQNKETVTKLAITIRNQLRKVRSPEASTKRFFQCSYNLEVFAKESRPVQHWIHDILKTSVVMAWGAYEVLADDLWHSVDTKRPALRAAWSKKEKGESGFLSRTKIANAYRYSFRVDNADILAIVDDPSVHSLGVARNVLVHSGGKIDEIFQKDRRGLSPLNKIRGKRLGYEIIFTADFVTFLIEPVRAKGFELVKAVDEWLTNHP